MSIEVESPEQTSQPAVDRPVLLPSRPQPLALWRRRRVQVAAIALAVVVVAAFAANNFLARQYSAEGAVRQYLSALQSGNAGSAWNVMQVSAPNTRPAESLLDRQALQAALAAARPDLSSYAIDSTTQVDSSTSNVAFSYDTSNGSRQAAYVVKHSGKSDFLLYEGWRVQIAPAILQLTLPSGGQPVEIDGKSLALSPGTSAIAALPVAHKIRFQGTALIEAQTVTVDAFSNSAVSVTYEPKLTSAGLAKVQSAVSTYFNSCAQKTGLQPSGCPQNYASFVAGSAQWRLVGDPTQSMSLAFGQDGLLSAIGHFQMVISYQEDGVTGTAHDVVAGGYAASLVLTSTDVTVTSISSDDKVAPLQRPAAATDQAAKDLVAAAMKTCATRSGFQPADCPQALFKGYADNVHWKLNGDPLAGATVAFDPNTGIYAVKGTFQMSASYSVNGYANTDTSPYDHYTAYLLWDGQALQLVTIGGGFS